MPIKKITELSTITGEDLNKINLFETRRFFLDVYVLRAGQEQKPHTHEENDKVYFVLSGDVRFVDGDSVVHGEQGDAMFAPAGHLHGVLNEGPEDAMLLVFMAPHPHPEGL